MQEGEKQDLMFLKRIEMLAEQVVSFINRLQERAEVAVVEKYRETFKRFESDIHRLARRYATSTNRSPSLTFGQYPWRRMFWVLGDVCFLTFFDVNRTSVSWNWCSSRQKWGGWRKSRDPAVKPYTQLDRRSCSTSFVISPSLYDISNGFKYRRSKKTCTSWGLFLGHPSLERPKL